MTPNTKIYEQAHSKINLSLDITGIRENGYHDVRMIMQSLHLCDDLTFTTLEKGEGILLVTDNEMLNKEQLEGSDNLIVKAAKLLEEKAGFSFDVKIELVKRIPIAAGMGGGSADAAATLRGLNRLYNLGLSMEDLRILGVKIGADVPFCVEGGLCLSEGIGEILTQLTPQPSYPTVICKPNVYVSTKDVYKAYDSLAKPYHPDVDGMIKAIDEYKPIEVAKLLGNSLEQVTVEMHPVIKDIEKAMLELGANNSIMTGSGPTVFGLFNSEIESIEAANKLKEQFPEFQIVATKFLSNRKERFE